MIKLRQVLRDHKEAGPLHLLMPFYGFLNEEVFLTKAGDVGMVLRVSGVDCECLDHGELESVCRRMEAALKLFDERFRIYQYLLKRPYGEIPSEDCRDQPILDEALKARSKHMENQTAGLFQLETYFIVLLNGSDQSQGLEEKVSRVSRRPISTVTRAISSEKKRVLIEDEINQATETITGYVSSFVIQLRGFLDAEILDCHEAFRFFRRLVNYDPVKAEAVRFSHQTLLDYSVCSESVECYRDHLRLEDNYVKVLTLKEPPGQTSANLFKSLLELKSSFIAVIEWNLQSNAAMRKRIQSARRHHHNSRYSIFAYLGSSRERTSSSSTELLKDDAAEAMVLELGSCLKEMEVEGKYFGRFSLTLVLHSPARAKLARSVAECYKIFSTQDAGIIEERYNLLNAWLAIIPGNYAFNLRYLYLLNTNLADLSFVFTIQKGEERNRHLDAEHLALFETRYGTPYFLNLHSLDVAHTLILGATGSGKSFLLNFLITHLQKYHPLTYIFDLGSGYRFLTEIFGGSYRKLGIAESHFSINPFSLPRTEENLEFLFSFVKVLAASSRYQTTNHDERDLYAQIESLYELEPENRRLRTLANILGRNLREALARWVEGGQYGRLFDNVEDNLTLSRFQCFEFEGMERYPQVIEPLLFYVLHRTSAAIHDSDRFKVFVIDEAWRFLKDATIKHYITEALKTWRKHNAAMILATQSSTDLESSDMISAVVESCPTKLFLASPGIDLATYALTFHLNETETQLITELVSRQEILIKRPEVSRIAGLTVDPQSYWFYTSDTRDIERRQQAFDQYPFDEALEHLCARAQN